MLHYQEWKLCICKKKNYVSRSPNTNKRMKSHILYSVFMQQLVIIKGKKSKNLFST